MNKITRSIVAVGEAVAGAISIDAGAIALYNRQTGQPCAACHTAPPELTPFGRRFMLGGFTMSGGKTGIPLSGYRRSRIHNDIEGCDRRPAGPARQQQRRDPEDQGDYRRRDHRYDRRLRGSRLRRDRRATQARQRRRATFRQRSRVGRHDLLYGITLNNNPGFQDPWNSTLARTWPYARSAADADAAHVGRCSTGRWHSARSALSGYGFIDDAFYLELGGYRKIESRHAGLAGPRSGQTRERSTASRSTRGSRTRAKVPGGTLTVGASTARRRPEPSRRARQRHGQGAATWASTCSTNGAAGRTRRRCAPRPNRERWSLGSSVAQGLATNTSNHLDNVRLSASYLYAQALFGDGGLFPPKRIDRSRCSSGRSTAQPDTRASSSMRS